MNITLNIRHTIYNNQATDVDCVSARVINTTSIYSHNISICLDSNDDVLIIIIATRVLGESIFSSVQCDC